MSMRLVISRRETLEDDLAGLSASERVSAVLFGSAYNDCRDICRNVGVDIFSADYLEDTREQMLSDYIDLVARIGGKMNSRIWWATDMASKNRFTSRLLDLLEQVFVVKRAVDEGRDTLIVVGLYPEVFSTLKKMDLNISVAYRVSCLGKMRLVLWRMGQACRSFVVVLWRRYRSRKMLVATHQRLENLEAPAIVVKTFIYPHSFDVDGAYNDVFFGRLPEFICKKSEPLVIFASVINGFSECLRKMAADTGYIIVPVEMMVPVASLVKALFAVVLKPVRVTSPCMFRSVDVSLLINDELSRTINGIQVYHYFHYEFTKALLGEVEVDTFIYTCENNPWERMALLALNRYSASTRTIGYQHAVVPQASVNMFPGKGEVKVMPMPDYLFTTGEKPTEILERYGNYDSGTVVTSCGLRYEALSQISVADRVDGRRNVLLALEGVADVVPMVEYALRELAGMPEYTLRVRAHPAFPFERIKRMISTSCPLPEGLEISTDSTLNEDLGWSDVVMYWGSTVALEAIASGKPVVHFDMCSVLSYDPLFQLQSFKWRVSVFECFPDVLEDIFGMDGESYNAFRCKGIEYISRYFTPVTEQALNEFIKR